MFFCQCEADVKAEGWLWEEQLNMGWPGFAAFQRPAHALVTKSRWLPQIKVFSVELSRVHRECCSGNQSAGSGNYWKPPISCRQLDCATGPTRVLSLSSTARPFISREVEAINLAKVIFENKNKNCS